MDLRKRRLIKLLSGACLCVFMCFWFSTVSEAAGKEGIDLLEGAEYEAGEAFHREGDMLLTSDYTMPEDCLLHWYSGDLTIASGVTLTIPEGSFLDISTPVENSFVVEEGACIRIEGAPQIDEEEGNPVRHLTVYGAETRFDGTIESDNVGLTCRFNKAYLNGTIHAAQQFLMTEQCQVHITGGEYSSQMKKPVAEVYTGSYESVIEISGGRFSGNELKKYLMPGYALEKQEDGMYEAVSHEEGEQGGADNPIESADIKEQAIQIWEYAKELFNEAKQDSIQEDGSWVNGDIVVVILCVGTVGICLLLVIIDFIRSPLKKKFKILVELIVAGGIVGGGIWFLWKQVQEERQLQADERYVDYEENTVPDAMLLQNETAELNGLEVYPEGTYLVGRDLEPGTYFFETEDPQSQSPAYYVYSSDTPDFAEKEIGAWIMRSYLELKEDSYIRVIGANFVKAGEQPAYEPEEEAGDAVYLPGEYLVGYDIVPGTYQMTVDLYDITITDEVQDDKSMNFTDHDGVYYEGGTTEITLRDGQHLYVHAGVTVRLAR